MAYNENEEYVEKVNNTLTAGVCADGLKDGMSIKVFICFLVDRFKGILTKTDIIDVVFERELVNYFEICAAIEELIANGFVLCDAETGILSLSSSGRMTVESLTNDLPLTVREKAVYAMEKRFERRHHEQETSVEIVDVEDGCQINCTLLGSTSPMMSVSLYLPDRNRALDAKERFIDDPEYVYRILLAHLTGEASLAPKNDQN